MKTLYLLLVPLLLFACNQNASNTQNTTNPESESIYLLDSKWQTHTGETVHLSDLEGKNTVVTMIFTSCTTACPLLVADMKKIYDGLDAKHKKDTQMVLFSIDPKNDSVEALAKYADLHHLDSPNWKLMVSDEENIRNLANVLAVKYKEISPVEFSHSNIITVLDGNGVIVKQVEGTVNHHKISSAVNSL